MKKNNRIILVTSSILASSLVSSKLKDKDVVLVDDLDEYKKNQKAFDTPIINEDELLPTNPAPIKKTNPWPEPHSSSKRKRRY